MTKFAAESSYSVFFLEGKKSNNPSTAHLLPKTKALEWTTDFLLPPFKALFSLLIAHVTSKWEQIIPELSCQFISGQQERKVCWNLTEESPGEHYTETADNQNLHLRMLAEPTVSLSWATGIYPTPTSLDQSLDSYVWTLQDKPAMKSEGLGMILSAFGNCWMPGNHGSWKAPVEIGWSNTLAQSRVNQSKLLRAVSSQVSNTCMNGDSKTYYILTGTLGSSVAENWSFDNIKLRFRIVFNDS